jgi:DNA repair ATPase RecN
MKAISIIENLVYLTNEDIQDIAKKSKQDVFSNVSIKEQMISNFNDIKLQIDTEILKLTNSSSNIQDILDDEIKSSLNMLEEKMYILKELNKKYNRLVISIGDFYVSLLNKLIPNEMDKYNNINKKSYLLDITI